MSFELITYLSNECAIASVTGNYKMMLVCSEQISVILSRMI
jgi:hypothetical protein